MFLTLKRPGYQLLNFDLSVPSRTRLRVQHQVRAGFRPTHLLAFREALSDHRVDGGLDEGGRDPLPVSMPLGIVHNGVCMVGDAGVELIDTFAERLDARVCGVETRQVHRQIGNAGQSRAVIAVP